MMSGDAPVPEKRFYERIDSRRFESNWYLVHCKPREDDRALENLERQGFQCYRPILAIEQCRLSRKRVADRSLFPGYIFIQLDHVRDNWALIRSTRGVIQLVRFGNYPVRVADAVIERIRIRLSSAEAEPYLRTGEHVRITGGAFSQLEAIFIANDGDRRVILLLNILQTDQALSFPLESVRRIG